MVMIVGTSSFAATKKFCGKRDGTAGDAYLVDKKNVPVITLAMQGNGDTLLAQADSFIGADSKGETGTQNGQKYCVIAEVDKSGEPTKIIKAFRER